MITVKYLNILIIPVLILLVLPSAKGQSQAIDLSAENAWADSVLNSLDLDEKIAQLLIVRANYPGEKYNTRIDKYIRQYNIGGVTFFGGHPTNQARQANRWQQMARTPLLVTIDAEWGLGMRLDSVIAFPYQMTLGAIRDDSLVYLMGRHIGRHCKRIGVHMNFAPVVDINSNPANPVINMRSFGEDRLNVSSKGTAFMKGMQDESILAVAKHFPGHGDTENDSHHTLPVIHHDRSRLDSLELFPFRKLINEGVAGVMTAHLYVPEIENTENLASTLSYKVVNDLLKNEMGYEGLIITDALDMKGVTSYFPTGTIEVKALLAGNDILLLSADVPKAIKQLKKAVKDGRIPEEKIDERCRKILIYKYRAGLHEWAPVEVRGLYQDLNSPQSAALNRSLFEEAITLVKNNDEILPLERLDTLKIASLAIGNGDGTRFQERLSYYARVDHYQLDKNPKKKAINSLFEQLKKYNLVIVSLQHTGTWAGNNFGISKASVDIIRKLQESTRIILDIFASPYTLKLFRDDHQLEAIIISYQDHEFSQDLSAQAIFGGIPFKGRLPVSATGEYPLLTGIETVKTRLGYTIPEALGISSGDLLVVDSIINRSIELKAFPGCQVMAIKDGTVFFMKSYGYHTYANKRMVGDFDLYDLASLTKVSATIPSVMYLYEHRRIDIDQVLLKYLPYLKGTDKANIVIREMLAHQSRFQPWIPYYRSTITKGKKDPDIYSNEIDEAHTMRVAENLYIKESYKHVIFDSIINSPLRNESTYKYSDLGFYLLKEIIENITNMDMATYVSRQFYKPLGLSTAGYLPRRHFPLERLVPTEHDRSFRKQVLQGDVHDQGAAMLGGISGHAGVFSNANDMAILMQMYLQEGNYGGWQFFRPGTLQEFTRQQFPLNDNRRGIGFDRPLAEYEEDGPNCESASAKSFGHSGFTGTYMWADPENGLVYVFLSNRIHPDAGNGVIYKYNIRTGIHQVFYDAIEKNMKFAN